MIEFLYFAFLNFIGAIYAYYIWDFFDPPECRMRPINIDKHIKEAEAERNSKD